jgi:hypothetical protein
MLFTALAATATILMAGSIPWKAEAATVTGVGSLPALTKTYSITAMATGRMVMGMAGPTRTTQNVKGYVWQGPTVRLSLRLKSVCLWPGPSTLSLAKASLAESDVASVKGGNARPSRFDTLPCSW